MMKLSLTSPVLINVGIHLRENYFDIVYFSKKRKPHYFSVSMSDKDSILEKVMGEFALFSENNYKIQFITSISPNQLWTHSIILPQTLQQKEYEQQCHYLLEQYLPIPIEDIYFDYRIEPMSHNDQSTKLEICAIQKSLAEQFVEKFNPLKINVLDTQTRALIRAVKYLDSSVDLMETALLLQDQDLKLALYYQNHKLCWLQGRYINWQTLVTQFQQRYVIEPRYLLLNSEQLRNEEIPQNWQRINTDLPILALGNALWNTKE